MLSIATGLMLDFIYEVAVGVFRLNGLLRVALLKTTTI